MPSPPLAFTVPIPSFPLIGDRAVIAFFFLAHIAVAEYSAGAITLAPILETWGARRNDARGLRYARSLANTYYLVFSLGATLAVFAIVLLTGLRGREFGDLLNALLPVMALAFGLFLILAPLVVWYRNSFSRMDPRRHAALGATVAFWQLLFIVCIVTLDSYLITPYHGGFLAATTNPPYLPLLVHRLIGNVSWTALFLAAFAALKLRRVLSDDEHRFQAWALRLNLRIGLITAVTMPVDGFILLEVLKGSQFGYFDNLVSNQRPWLFIVQEALLAVIYVGGNVALLREPGGDARWNGVGRVAVAVSLAGMVLGCMPSAVLSGGTLWLRYAGIGTAAAVTLVHTVVRCLPRRSPSFAPATAITSTSWRVLTAVGVASAVVALLMGYIKEQGRGNYSIYGELTSQDARGHFEPPAGTYP